MWLFLASPWMDVGKSIDGGQVYFHRLARCRNLRWTTLVFKKHRPRGGRDKFQLHRARAGLSEFFQEDHLSALVRPESFRWGRSSDTRDRRTDAVPGYLAPISRALTNPLGS